MISSRQVVELIEGEIVSTVDPKIKKAYNNLIELIESLENIEMDKMYTDFLVHEENERVRKEEVRKKAEEEFARVFKS